MKQANTGSAKPAWQYYKAHIPGSSLIIELSSLADFIRLAEQQSSRAIFTVEDAGSMHFAIAYHGGLLQQASEGYEQLEDYLQAQKSGFTAAADYYAACAGGYTSYDDYKLALDNGVAEAGSVAEMKQKGFADGFLRYGDLRATLAENKLPDPGDAANAWALMQLAKERQFDTWSAMEEALLAGFANSGDHTAAKAKGFSTAAIYENAVSRGFSSMRDYELAEKHHFRDAADGIRFFDIELMAGGPGLPHDQKLLLALLSRLEQGKRVSANKLWEHVDKMVAEYRYDPDGDMPLWFTRAVHSREDVVAFLSGQDQVKDYGSYDRDGEFFESKKLKDREVVLDGSNVAFGSGNANERVAYAANMLRMVRFLRANGFEQISIISDASLKHRLADPEVLKEVKDEAEYIEAPAEKPADVFIIHHVRNRHCLLVSNDTFREWKVQEPWVAENIDYYRLTFVIKGEEVIMPDVR